MKCKIMPISEVKEDKRIGVIFTEQTMRTMADKYKVSLPYRIMSGTYGKHNKFFCHFDNACWWFDTEEIEGWFELPESVAYIDVDGFWSKCDVQANPDVVIDNEYVYINL